MSFSFSSHDRLSAVPIVSLFNLKKVKTET